MILPGRLRYDPRRFDGRNEVDDSTQFRLVSCYLGDALRVVHPVLQRQEHRVGTDQRTNTLCCGVGIVGLDAEEDQIDVTYLVRGICGPHRQRELSCQPGLHRQSPQAQRFEVGSVSDEGYLFPGPSKKPTEISARSAAAHDRDANGHPPVPLAFKPCWLLVMRTA
jgi:hypothetical protein